MINQVQKKTVSPIEFSEKLKKCRELYKEQQIKQATQILDRAGGHEHGVYELLILGNPEVAGRTELPVEQLYRSAGRPGLHHQPERRLPLQKHQQRTPRQEQTTLHEVQQRHLISMIKYNLLTFIFLFYYMDNLDSQKIKYPTNRYGQKAEWFAVENQKNQIANSIQNLEKQIKDVKKKDFVQQNDSLMNEIFLNKQNQENFKKQELEFIQQKQQEHQLYVQHGQDAKNRHQKQIQEIYSDQIKNKQDVNFLQKQISNVNDQSHIQQMRLDLLKEKQRHDNTIQKYDNLNEVHQQQYSKWVLQPNIQKQVQYQQYVQNKIQERNNLLLQKEQNRYNEVKSLNNNIILQNQLQLEEKNQNRSYEFNLKQQSIENRLQNLQMQKNQIEMEKQNKTIQQNEYRENLDRQKLEREQNRNLDDKMEGRQKKMNQQFLQDFKKQNVNINTSLPGLQPQIGGVSNRHLQRMLEPGEGSQKQGQKEKRVETQAKYVNEKERLMNAWLAPSLSQPANLYNYNPITNPVPFLNQNPYLQKDSLSLRGSRSRQSHRSLQFLQNN